MFIPRPQDFALILPSRPHVFALILLSRPRAFALTLLSKLQAFALILHALDLLERSPQPFRFSRVAILRLGSRQKDSQ